MKYLSSFALIAGLSLVPALTQCSSSEDSFGSGGTGATGSTPATNGTMGGSGSGTNPGLGFGGGGGVPPISSTDTCGTTDVAAEPIPVYMVFVYDKSASMGLNVFTDATTGVTTTIDNTELRWNPVKNAMIEFFSKAGTTNVQASIAYFAAPGDKATTCAHDYSVPDVPMTRLEAPAALVNSLEATVPNGGTPTLPAVIGGIKYAKKLLNDHPGSEAIVVLVTDGEPAIYNSATGKTETDCAPPGITLTNTNGDISDYIVGAADPTSATPVVTHVIGIGDVTTMQGVFTAKGIDFIVVSPTDPAATRTTILEKLKAIQPKTIACKVALPTTTDGFDKSKVNVNFVHGGGSVDEFSRSDDCTKPGWRYDNATTPKYIELCPATCTAVQQDLTGSVKIILGCPTRVIQ